MRRAIVALCVVAATVGCDGTDRTIHPADDALLDELGEYAAMSRLHHMKLADEREPGERLIVLGRLVRAEDGEPIPYHRLHAYQADNEGSYDEEATGDDTTARLRGVVQTDGTGRFMLETILPGDYGSTPGNRHIHLTVPGAKPEAYDFYFKQYAGRGLTSWVEGSDQAVMLDLKRDGAGLIAAADLPVKGYRAPVAVAGR